MSCDYCCCGGPNCKDAKMITDQQVTDAEVEAAARAICRLRIIDTGKHDPDEITPGDMVTMTDKLWHRWTEEGRAALLSAARVRALQAAADGEVEQVLPPIAELIEMCRRHCPSGTRPSAQEAMALVGEIDRLVAERDDAQADALRLFKLAADRWSALLELQCRDERNGSLPPAYRKIIDDALANGQSPRTPPKDGN